MSVKLVIRAEVETADDLAGVIKAWLAMPPGALEIELWHTYVRGMTEGLRTDVATDVGDDITQPTSTEAANV